MSVSVPLTSFFNDVKIGVTSYFMYRVSHEGKYCTKFLNQYSFIYSKFYINFINITLIYHITKHVLCLSLDFLTRQGNTSTIEAIFVYSGCGRVV